MSTLTMLLLGQGTTNFLKRNLLFAILAVPKFRDHLGHLKSDLRLHLNNIELARAATTQRLKTKMFLEYEFL